MKKVININFQGQVIAIEETAYEILQRYTESLKSYFSREEGGDEIVNDIEGRIAELFGNRLKLGISCITDEDVEGVIASIGRPEEFDSDFEETATGEQERASGESEKKGQDSGHPKKEESCEQEKSESRSLSRNSNDRIIAGVCSGLAHYFKTDPVWIRMLFILFFGLLFWVYIVLWIVLKPKALESNTVKRLYRNPNDRFIGGVCGGLAAYFKIDSWIPRLIFLIPLLIGIVGGISVFPLNWLFDRFDINWHFYGGMVLLYLVFWLITPKAKTVKQKLEMLGEEEYIRSIRETVNDNVANVKNRTAADASDAEKMAFASTAGGSDAAMSGIPPQPPHGNQAYPNAASTTPQSERSGCLNALITFLKIIFFSIVGFVGLILIIVAFALFFSGTKLLPLKPLFVDPGFETLLLWLTFILTFLVPVVAFIVWMVRRAIKAKSRPMIGVIATILWICGFVCGGILTAKVANKFKMDSFSEKTMDITPVSSDKLYLKMIPYPEDYGEYKTRIFWDGNRFGFSGLDTLPFSTIDEDSLLFRNIHINVLESSDSLFHLKTIGVGRGRNIRRVQDDIAQFSYPITQIDSTLYLPEFLKVPMEQGFRDQSMTIEVSVPVGKSVEISDDLKDYKEDYRKIFRKRTRKYSRTTLPIDTEECSREESELFVKALRQPEEPVVSIRPETI